MRTWPSPRPTPPQSVPRWHRNGTCDPDHKDTNLFRSGPQIPEEHGLCKKHKERGLRKMLADRQHQGRERTRRGRRGPRKARGGQTKIPEDGSDRLSTCLPRSPQAGGRLMPVPPRVSGSAGHRPRPGCGGSGSSGSGSGSGAQRCPGPTKAPRRPQNRGLCLPV